MRALTLSSQFRLHFFFSKQSLEFHYAVWFSLPALFFKFLLNINFTLLKLQECGAGIRHNDTDKFFHCSAVDTAHIHPLAQWFLQNLEARSSHLVNEYELSTAQIWGRETRLVKCALVGTAVGEKLCPGWIKLYPR